MINKVLLLGNLGKDPDTRFTSGGKAVTTFSVATSETWIGANGEKKQTTEWHNIVVWGKQGEACGQYLAKGRQVYVEGSIRHRSYDKNGQEQRVDEIVAQKVRFLGGGNGKANGEQPPPADPDNDDVSF